MAAVSAPTNGCASSSTIHEVPSSSSSYLPDGYVTNTELTIGLGDYLEEDARALVAEQANYRNGRVGRVAVLLRELGVANDECSKYAREAIDGQLGALSLNGATMTSTRSSMNVYQDICNVCNEAADTEDKQILFIYASEAGVCEQKWQQLIDHFIGIAYPRAPVVHASRFQKRVGVKSIEEIQESIRRFVMIETDDVTASRAVHAMIVFIGCSSPDGFQLFPGKPVDVRKISSFVDNCWKISMRQRPSRGLPSRLDIVYAEYGNESYSQKAVKCEQFKVVRLMNNRAEDVNNDGFVVTVKA